VIAGGNDTAVASRQILAGSHLMNGDFASPPPAVLKQALATRKGQLDIGPTQGVRFIALNTRVKPLDNLNVRRAIAAAIDRDALRRIRGGWVTGTVATHFIPPGIPGFDQAGGVSGPKYDFDEHPDGDLSLAKTYMRKAGYPSGVYTGKRLLMVGDDQPPESKTAEAVQSQLAALGIRLNFREMPHATMFSKFCQVPKAAVAICPNGAWGKDFFDAQSMLDPVFNGKNIIPSGNTNLSQANDPRINSELDRALLVTDPALRATLYGDIDRQVTGQAFVVTYLWDNQVNIASKDVKGVRSRFNSSWDLTYSSLK
jgi:peptide/nickel transport system substrate-binding protein